MSTYFDNAATSRTRPEGVYVAMDRFMRDIGVSAGRSVHVPGIEAGRIVEKTRRLAAALFGVGDSSRVVFMLNCTAALNTAVKGILNAGDHVVTTSVEHNAVMRPLSAVTADRGVAVSRAAADGEGVTDPESFARLFRPETRLAVMTHASNVTGAIQPIEECGRIAREHGVPLLVDAAQTGGCIPLALSNMPVDLIAFSGHKGLMGPQGVGGLCLRESVEPTPLVHGGTGSRSSEDIQPGMLPDRYESGTANMPGLAGLGAALAFVLAETVEAIRERVCSLGAGILDGLSAVKGVTLFGPRDMARNIGVFSFRVAGKDPAAAARELETKHGILTRVGLHCAPSAHRTIGTFPEGTIRASIGCFTTEDDAAALLQGVEAICRER